MISILKSPYPCVYGQKENFWTALAIGIFVAVFLLVFQPFSIAESLDSFKPLKSVGFGLVSFLVLLIFYFVIPKVFKSFFAEKNYTLGKELLASIGLIVMIGLANGIYAQFILNESALVSVGVMIWQTFLVGIFPLTFLSLLQYNRQLKINLKASEGIQIPAASIQSDNIDNKLFSMPGSEDEFSIPLSNVLYIESDGNYVDLHIIRNSNTEKIMYRATLKSIEESNPYSNLFRCHRSYIVNLNHITAVNGNAQGLKLSLMDTDDLVTVSKKYIPVFKEQFNPEQLT